ncbi:hypothetical protein HCN44_004305 [Aphidius gifuensis]|uniref:DE-cadherin n=1 Tax=Aphidius gifuensis TaxID=684658 RepID=A0A835CUZ3_APHGI|nr:DE-cadherin [Aphidius gifuensis]KAF7994833.1 hypothetical protein HCN44_004305 [Aphidius gifuensis]
MEVVRCWDRWARLVGTISLFILIIGSLGDATKMRHSRHSEPRQEHPNNDKSVAKNDGHNHKPVFTNCNNYHPTMKEEERPGYEVIQVQAVDPDPINQGGKITYSLEKEPLERLKFEINNVTGWIRTTQFFDRDEPYREKEAWLTVIATDNGFFRLTDVCSFKVIIEDINDNAPVFDRVSYDESVPKDLPVGRRVMTLSATDIDDGNKAVVRFNISSLRPDENDYFKVNPETGIITLNKKIDKEEGYKFKLIARATDQGQEPKSEEIRLTIEIVESNKKSPSFTLIEPNSTISIQENSHDFDNNIITLQAQSNIDDKPRVLFSLINGVTEPMNKHGTFKLNSDGNTAHIRLAQTLDYGKTNEYTLLVRVMNDHNLGAETKIHINVLDVNDHSPVFNDIKVGGVLENEPEGTFVMQVRASDADGTEEHNQITYKLGNYDDLFKIDEKTGNITTLKVFDREREGIYDLKVIATDSSPSANSKTGEHNYLESTFRIEIGDKNDNPPHFNESVYTARSVGENSNKHKIVVQVHANDEDIASPVTYSIISGNTADTFYIEAETGRIRVNNPPDYEKYPSYNLTVRASDGNADDTATVRIFIENINDNPPEFEEFERNPIIDEEFLFQGCLTTVKAYDPDVTDRSADQHIVYSIKDIDQQPLISIDQYGCMKLKKPLDRDLPNGRSTWVINVKARDEDGGPNSIQSLVEVHITLNDINDNAPFLDMKEPVIWRENKEPGKITKLQARDYDSDKNGPPFKYYIDINQENEDINNKFTIADGYLYAKVKFDREEKKSYNIPITISDGGEPTMTGTSTLIVIIGDENDNPMNEGSSSIFVYNYRGESPDTDIGRVYVDDKDDWDLADKYFQWYNNDNQPGFDLNSNTGMITMLSGTKSGNYILNFTVTEASLLIESHTVNAQVSITIKDIPEEAVLRSGSIRLLNITQEEFIIKDIDTKKSIKDRFQEEYAKILNISVENVDVFTVLHSPHNNQNKSLLDVRFSAHASPYWASEKLNTILTENYDKLSDELNVNIMLINIDECLFEKLHCNNSCRNYLNISTVPYSVFTNTSSFVGVRAVVDPLCTCHIAEPPVCLNGGTPLKDRCECPPNFDGPHCELLGIGFDGNGWSIMPSPGQACDESHVGLEVTPYNKDGLIFYFGPMYFNPLINIQDFMSLEIQNGLAVLYVDYGTGTVKLEHNETILTDGKSHKIDVLWTKTTIELKVDNCGTSICMRLTAPLGTNEFLNVNSPIQIGGSLTQFNELRQHYSWNYTPTQKGFSGCIKNMTINGNTLNLGMPSYHHNTKLGCTLETNAAASFVVRSKFILPLLASFLGLALFIIVFVMIKKKDNDLYKDMDDIRENIINYEDEGGGEVDTGFDLNVLRRIYDDQPIDSKIAPSILQGRAADEVPDICGFLDGKKESCDKDPDTNPFDDVRHYAYEGEGNSDGSLSSLASCTDDGDLKFNYLSNFGPRFRKLADMYGEEPSDEESDGVEERESESWC